MAKQRSFFDKVLQKVRRDCGALWKSRSLDMVRVLLNTAPGTRETCDLTGAGMFPNLQQEAMMVEDLDRLYDMGFYELEDIPFYPGLVLAWEDEPVTVQVDDALLDYGRTIDVSFADVPLDRIRELFPACLLIDVRNRELVMYDISVDALFIYPSYDADCGYELLLIVGVSLRHGLAEPLCGKFVMREELLGSAIDHTIAERERLRKRCLSGTDYGYHDFIFAPYEDEEKIMLLAVETLGLMCWEGAAIDQSMLRRRRHLRVRQRTDADGPRKSLAVRPRPKPEPKPRPKSESMPVPTAEPVAVLAPEPKPEHESTPEPTSVAEPQATTPTEPPPAVESVAARAPEPVSVVKPPVAASPVVSSHDSAFEEELLEEVARLEAKAAEQDAKVLSLSHHLKQAEQSLRESQALLRARSERAEVLEQMDLPTTPVGALELAGRAFADRLIVLDSARKSAEEFVRGSTPEVWAVLRSMAMRLHPLVFGQGGGNVVYAFEAQTGFELTLREMKQVKRVESLAKLRAVTYKGSQHSIAPHVKGRGRARGETLRVHFFADYEERKLVIAHCGEHLPTFDTSSL